MSSYTSPNYKVRLIVSLVVCFLFSGLLVSGGIANTTVNTPNASSVTLAMEPVIEDTQPEAVVVNPGITKPSVNHPYNARQLELLRLAYEVGSEVGWPETVQAILLQETSAGLHGPVGDRNLGFGERSYCHMQVKLSAAADVIKHFDDVPSFTTEEELLVALLTDDEFCIRVGARYFKLMMDRTNTWGEAVVAYNRGVTGSRLYGDVGAYLPKIRARIHQEIRPYSVLLGYEELQFAMN